MGITDITGGSFTAVTVKLNAWDTVVVASLNRKTIFETPLLFATGVKVPMQFGAVPLNAIFVTGNIAAFDDVADIDVVQLKTLSTSVIVKFTVLRPSSKIV